MEPSFNIKKNYIGYFILLLMFVLVVMLSFSFTFFDVNKNKRIDSRQKISLPFSTNKHIKVVLLYFGYVGCTKICVPSLTEISEIYNKVNNTDKVEFYFINISEDGSGVKEFANSFQKNFIGLQLSKEETEKLMNSLKAYKSDPLIK